MFNTSYFSLNRLIFPLIILFFIVSCDDNVKPLEFESVIIKNTFDAEIEFQFDKAKETSEIAKAINKTIASEILKSIPISENKTIETLEEALTAFNAEYTTFKTNFEDSSQVWALAIETEVLYTTESIVTVALSVYSDTGGAHGNDTIQFLNFDSQTGKRYSNEDLLSNIEGFKTLAKSFFLEHMKNEGSDISEFFFGKPFQLPENIGFSEEGVVLLYNVYEIASYSQGYTEFVIPSDKAQEFLKIQLE